ncbi:MAG: MmgE/PrpD family protein [Dehalobacterium sp.]
MSTKEISKICETLNYSDIFPEIVDMAKRCLMDFLGAAIAGYHINSAVIAIKAAKHLGQEGQCTVIGSPYSMSLLGAAFANGTLGSALDIDDGHRGAVGHPGAMVFPTALAVGELNHVSGKEFISAVVVGYELAIRCGMVMNSNHEKRFYGSGGWAIFGSAAVAARLLGLKGEKFQNAITMGEVYGPTAQCGKSIAYGAMTKESIGWGAATGVFAALLAREGFTGPEEILLDEEDYTVSGAKIFSDLGKSYEIKNIYFKEFPSCRWSHAPITAALRIKEQFHPNYQDIAEVRVETFKKALTLDHQTPKSSEAAQYSIPFTVASVLINGCLGPAEVSEKNLHHLELRKLMKKIKLLHAEDLEPLFPRVRPARVTIRLADGSSFSNEVHLMHGDPEVPLTWDDIIHKFTNLTSPFLDQENREKIIKTVSHFEHLPDIHVLTKLLSFNNLMLRRI